MEDISDALEKLLQVSVKKLDDKVSGCIISRGSIFRTEDNKLIFVKENSEPGSDKMYNGEIEGLNTIRSIKALYAPRPITSGRVNDDHHFIVMEYLNITTFSLKFLLKIGSLLADMHLHNLLGKQQSVNKFGFHVDTCNGLIPQNNSWTHDWLTFFTENRLAYQIRLLQSNSKISDQNKTLIANYWRKLKPIIPKFFEGIEVKPSLLHGDLWEGNSGETKSMPVIFDPATFYGHHEYDIAATYMFSGYPSEFYYAYFQKIPKAKGFKNRMTLYHLFYYLNLWYDIFNNKIKGSDPIIHVIYKIYNDLLTLFIPFWNLSYNRILL